ncbi:hypothetical protein CSC94_19565 [Zhengella mangrovi]|uniref:Glycine zipper domain-containing protein n=1 Tax=Zhengella mangrovi TaxID=1982044 RepID=A0A2G1QIH6_9HYPH|nr:hypothetical protein [Zhengella mangrovi]PHP65326.1 hypothetical protein CSC94_19565 [Zhengella mangrovi]
MKNALVIVGMCLALAACTTAERDAATGGAIGAAAGAIASGGRAGGTLAGAAIGAVSGVLIGRATRRGDCVYRDRRGRRYIDDCPAGY